MNIGIILAILAALGLGTGLGTGLGKNKVDIFGGSDSDSSIDNDSLYSLLKSYLRSQTGASLTGAQIEQNEWNAQQAEEAFQREREFYGERYQMATADMQAAGLNPALMYAGGNGLGQSQVAPQAQGQQVQPGMGMNGLFSLIGALNNAKVEKLLGQQRNDIFQQQIAVEQYNAETHRLEVESNNQRNVVLNDLTRLQSENQELANYILDHSKDYEVAKVKQYVNNLMAQFDLYASQVRTEQEKADYYVASAVLSNVQSNQVVTLLPYLERIQSANADSAEMEKAIKEVEKHTSQVLNESSFIQDVKETARAKMEAARMSKEWQDELMHSNRIDAMFGRVLRRMGISGNAALITGASGVNAAAGAANAAAAAAESAPIPVKGFYRGVP